MSFHKSIENIKRDIKKQILIKKVLNMASNSNIISETKNITKNITNNLNINLPTESKKNTLFDDKIDLEIINKNKDKTLLNLEVSYGEYLDNLIENKYEKLLTDYSQIKIINNNIINENLSINHENSYLRYTNNKLIKNINRCIDIVKFNNFILKQKNICNNYQKKFKVIMYQYIFLFKLNKLKIRFNLLNSFNYWLNKYRLKKKIINLSIKYNKFRLKEQVLNTFLSNKTVNKLLQATMYLWKLKTGN